MFHKVWNRDLNLSDFGQNINLPESSQNRKCLFWHRHILSFGKISIHKYVLKDLKNENCLGKHNRSRVSFYNISF